MRLMSSRKPQRPPKMSVLVAHGLARRAASLEPGSSLGSEKSLLDELGVGRSTLREALRLLELQGVVEIKVGPGGGPVIAEPDHGPLANTLAVALQATGLTVRELIAARRELEAAIARLAAEAATPEDIENLRRSNATMRECLDDEEAFLAENLAFHAHCATAAHNRIFALFHASLEHISDGHVMGIHYGIKERKLTLRAHEKIFAAIEAHDPDGAYEEMGRHLAQLDGHVAMHSPHLLDRPVRWVLDRG